MPMLKWLQKTNTNLENYWACHGGGARDVFKHTVKLKYTLSGKENAVYTPY